MLDSGAHITGLQSATHLEKAFRALKSPRGKQTVRVANAPIACCCETVTIWSAQ
jgi:hypothetical protein